MICRIALLLLLCPAPTAVLADPALALSDTPPPVPCCAAVPQAQAYLQHQAAQWVAVSAAVSAWQARLLVLYDEHRAKTGTDESGA